MKHLPIFLAFCLFGFYSVDAKNPFSNSKDSIVNKIVTENNFQGTQGWELERPALDREIEGYASQTSVNLGDSLSFYVNTNSPTYSFSLYRMGWYKGNGARLLHQSEKIIGIEQEMPKKADKTSLIECAWINPERLYIDKQWTTGVYLIKLEEHQTKKQSYIIFVVRDDDSPTDIVFALPVNTYQAYNFWGGKSLYHFSSGDSGNWGSTEGYAATKVSYDRPYARSNNPAAANGMGAGEFLTNYNPVLTGYPTSSAGWNYNMVRWMEKEGYDINYITNIDLHRSPKLLENSKLFLSQGHDEYWTSEMRTHTEQARDNGMHMAFFGANNMYWQIRLEESTHGNIQNRVIVCYKSADADPVKGANASVKFRDIPVNNSEAKFLGVRFISEPIDSDIVISNASHRFFKNTGLKDGDRLEGLLGYEVDGVSEDSPKELNILTASKAFRAKYSGISTKYKLLEFVSGLDHWIYLMVVIAMALSYALIKRLTRKKIINPKLGLVIFIIVLVGCSIVFYVQHRVSNYLTSNMVEYQIHPNAGKVFSSGTIQWSWGLDDYNAPELRTIRTNPNAATITKNIFEDFGIKNVGK